jgi:hypothetical protein
MSATGQVRTINEEKMKAFPGKVVGDFGAAPSSSRAYIGTKLGLYEAMAKSSTLCCTSNSLALGRPALGAVATEEALRNTVLPAVSSSFIEPPRRRLIASSKQVNRQRLSVV